ncbi:DNA/RNA non-specific endonuclease, partial [Bhargavaea beijingensis]|uniref:DNA/RNA non-specific endonuclease n=1 Tax=Bhargavaea beijingensis TaxID=426756 RepID=UPI0022241C9A
DFGISKITQNSPQNVILGELDNLGRPTGVTATITQDMIGTGSKASQSIKPPGFLGGGPGSPGHARGHLLGNQLGGPGKDARNLVTLYQTPVNSPVMRDFESSVRVAVEKGEVVRYQSIPIYEGNNLIPKGITLKARGTTSFSLAVTIINKK